MSATLRRVSASDQADEIISIVSLLRRLGHRYVLAFGDFRNIQLFASQYDTAATIELRQRLQRLEEFLQRFQQPDPD